MGTVEVVADQERGQNQGHHKGQDSRQLPGKGTRRAFAWPVSGLGPVLRFVHMAAMVT